MFFRMKYNESIAVWPVFKNLMGQKKSDMIKSNFYTECQMNSAKFSMNNTKFQKINHNKIY
jgi:hypothetical protein